MHLEEIVRTKVHRIWFSERLGVYHWVFYPEGFTEHYNGIAKTIEQAEQDIEACRSYHTRRETS